MSEQRQVPTVFISYSWTSEDHVAWVRGLAERLVADGVNVILDRWELKEGQDKYVFMEQMVTDPAVTKVLAICDQAYAEKADGRRGGVGTESQIISKEIYEKVRQEKFIPLVRGKTEDGTPFLPAFFRTRIYIDFCEYADFEEAYDRLLRNIFGRPDLKKPPLGTPPAYLFQDGITHVKPASGFQRLKEAVLKEKPNAEAYLREYLDTFIDSLESFRVPAAARSDREWDETIHASIVQFVPYRDNFLEFANFAAAYMDNEATYDAAFDFFERLIPFQFRPAGEYDWSEDRADNFRFIIWELFLYWLATLIRCQRYETAARFIEGTYQHTDCLGGGRYSTQGVTCFYEPIDSLDKDRKRRLKLSQPSVTAELIRERATRPKVAFRDLYQVDFLLFIRPFFPEPGAVREWWPRLCLHTRVDGSLGLFAKATLERGFAPLRRLLRVKTLADLVGKLKAMFENRDFLDVVRSGRPFGAYSQEIVNFEALQNAARAR